MVEQWCCNGVHEQGHTRASRGIVVDRIAMRAWQLQIIPARSQINDMDEFGICSSVDS